ncbi:MAG: sensor histidine kinase [Acidimicrobiales bacterium]
MPERPQVGTGPGTGGRRSALELRTAQDLVATAAHELNGPLTVLIGLVDLLEREVELPPADRREMVEAMGRQARHLAAVVADVLHIANGEPSSSPPLVPVSLVEVVADATEATASVGEANVHVSVEGKALADQVGLTRVVTNLLMNAHRYGGPEISVCSRDAGPWTAVTIADDGPGVPADVREVLFDRYTRGDNANGHHGLGIGLRVARDLVESFGGTLTYEPRTPAGTEFTIRLRTPPPAAVA